MRYSNLTIVYNYELSISDMYYKDIIPETKLHVVYEMFDFDNYYRLQNMLNLIDPTLL